MNTDDHAKARTKPQPNCNCQRCATCIDNARWERIFREKFADPYYYTSQQTRGASPVVDL
jgi:hypothetical protein